MGRPTKESSKHDRRDVPQSSGFRDYCLDVAFQISLACLLTAWTWQLLGPDAQTSLEQALRLGTVAVASILPVSLWISGSRWSLRIKIIVLVACLLVSLLLGIKSTCDFDAAGHVLEPAIVEHGQVVHRGLGLSYAIPPNFRVSLRPFMSDRETRQPNLKLKVPSRLRFGELANVCRMVQVLSPEEAGRRPASVLLEVQRYATADLNAFIVGIRHYEERVATLPNLEITQHTHLSRIAGLDLVEFEFFERKERLIARQVYVYTGKYMLNFMLTTQRKSDGRVFDEFLNSIQLQPIR